MSGYGGFASYYDLLTSDISYQKRGEYFHSLFRSYHPPGTILLDLACGTGSLSEVMSGLGWDVIGVDASEEMLSEAIQKKMDSGRDILYLCQEMQELDLYGTIDACICALDSLNHIIDENLLLQVFQKVSLFLHPEGIFVFDLNTEYKHNEILSGKTFVYDYDEVFCVWQNSDCHENIVDITLDIFGLQEDGCYLRETEVFSERAYNHEEILAFLKEAGLVFLACYGEDSFSRPNQEEERVIYVVKSGKEK